MNNSKPINLYAKALDFLSRRDYSYRELFTKPRSIRKILEAIKVVLEEMVTKNFNEERYIENYINAKKPEIWRTAN